jgi:hypothetical protein
MEKQKQKKFRKQIQGSIFLSEDLKVKLLNNLDRVNEEDLKMLSFLFGVAQVNQDSLIDKIAAFDDTFVPRVKYFIESEKNKYRKTVEKARRKEEKTEEILKKIE